MSSSIAFVNSAVTSSWLLRVLHAWALAEASRSSEDCDRATMELRREDDFWSGPALRIARPEFIEEGEESECWGLEGVGCVVRAREERRGDMTGLRLITASQAWPEVSRRCLKQSDIVTMPPSGGSRCDCVLQLEVEGRRVNSLRACREVGLDLHLSWSLVGDVTTFGDSNLRF